MKTYDIVDSPDNNFPFVAERGILQGLFPEHTHNYTELLVAMSGTGYQRSGNEYCRVTRGTVLTVPPPLAHQMEDMVDLELFVLKFDLNRLISFQYDLQNDPGFRSLFIQCPPALYKGNTVPPLQLNEKQLLHVLGLMEVMYQEFKEQKSGYQVIIRTHLLALTAYLSRCFLPEHTPISQRMEKIIPTVVYMEENLHRNIRIQELAGMIYLSPRQYDRVFKEIYGVSPSRYLAELRLNRACQLMADRNCILGEIWEQCGFTDNPFFYRQFKKRFGVTPKQYRAWLLSSIQE